MLFLFTLKKKAPPSRRVPARVMSTCQLDSSTGDNFLAPHHGEGCIHMPSPAPALNMQSYTSSYHLGAPFRVPFHLIKFIMNRDIAVVPSGWYDDRMVFWPSYKNTDRIERAALNEEQHEPNWPRFDVSVVRTCDNYKDALKIMQQYGKGFDTSDLQSEAENEELPEKRNRKPVHRLGDSDDSEEDPGNSDLTSLGLASQLHRQTPPSRRVPARVMSTCQLDSSTGDNFLAPHHGEGRIHMPSPAPALNMQRVTQGTAVPPRLPPPPSPTALNMWQTGEPGSSLAYRPTWRGERMADNISCSAPEVIHILSLLETIKHNQDQLIAKVL
ncbi:uncharacterized protein LOC133657458 isoform X2 [Entelurus aequoreus]|uniref:uncharacterized protein LOC133657458 isoform X2 n=1 Tax=Entelurus aequoreus TaxID=161455 RepID=UPI002B1DFBD0|nr:uncharacterized protein LOC133657458 isoform X2 [Entelurus aequoreus]XP_061914792.1 uncharacterized protein LOC133657458 isoform X2 [Entelurus aequoreus]